MEQQRRWSVRNRMLDVVRRVEQACKCLWSHGSQWDLSDKTELFGYFSSGLCAECVFSEFAWVSIRTHFVKPGCVCVCAFSHLRGLISQHAELSGEVWSTMPDE